MPDLRPIKFTLWLYFWLLLFEGVLRKWVLPQYSDALFIIRDPLVIVTYLLALRAGVFPFRTSILVLFVLAALTLVFSLGTDATIPVILFGMRTNYLHAPLVFVMARTLDRSDVIRFGRWTMWSALPILYLMWRQFASPANAPVNAGVSGSVGGQIRGAMGHIRPPGPFSFVSGVVFFFSLAGSYVLYGWLQRRTYSKLLVLAATGAIALVVPISLSRSVLAGLLVVAAFGLVVAVRDLKRAPAFLVPIAACLTLFAGAADTDYVEAYRTRWEESIEAGGGGFSGNVVGRMMADFTKPFEIASDTPILGYGVGMGTLAGARLLTGRYTFLLSESELARMVLELGPILGFAFIAWRIWLSLELVRQGWLAFRDGDDALSWLLAGACFMGMFNSQWGPATNLGFCVFTAGLSLAAANPPAEEAGDEEEEDQPVEELAAGDESMTADTSVPRSDDPAT